MSESTRSDPQALVERELVERIEAKPTDPFQRRTLEEAAREVEPQMQVYGPNAQCITDKSLGKATPQDRKGIFRCGQEALPCDGAFVNAP
jgi:hypothetical protein